MRRLERGFKREPRTLKNYLLEHPPWMVTNIAFCYDGEPQTNTDTEKKKMFPITCRETQKIIKYIRTYPRPKESK